MLFMKSIIDRISNKKDDGVYDYNNQQSKVYQLGQAYN